MNIPAKVITINPINLSNMQTKLHTLFVLMILSKVAYSQSVEQSQIKLKTIIPPTANASALGKFGDVPVGNYTGVPSVSISIHTIKIKDFELPVSLSYHGGGIKVEDIASDVGLGWALNAGGTISRMINGLDDLSTNGFLYTSGDPYKTLPDEPMTSPPSYDYSATGGPGGKPYNLAKNIADGACDGEPDLFFYNFCGKNGQFYFDQKQQAHTMPLNSLRIIIPISTANLVILDENGVKYTFQDKESTFMNSSCGPGDGNGSWLLSRIDLPDKNYIQFNYTTISYDYKINLTLARNDIMSGNYGPGIVECTNTNKTVNCTGKKLISINSSVGDTVLFGYAAVDRADLPGTKSLSTITIKHYNRVVNNYTFVQGYFNGAQPAAQSDYCRLKLEQISDLAGGVHKFDYDTSRPLPGRLSFEQDHWGFWNGKFGNTSLLPLDIEHGFLAGNSRELDTNYAKIGLLKRITYPTGGYTDLQYEPNDYFFSGDKYTYVFRDQQLYQSSAIGATVTKSFVIPAGSASTSSFIAYYNAGSGSVLEPEPENPPLSMSLTGPNGYYRTFYNTTTASGIELENLTPGTYTMQITTNSNYSSGYLRITYYERVTTTVNENTLLGGVRIKRTIDYPMVGAPVTKKYIYRQFADTTRSSGRINYQPVYTAGYTHTNNQWQTNSMGDTVGVTFSYTNYWKQSASTVMPLGSINGGSVAYINVTILRGENGENGKMEYEYSFAQRSVINQWYPFVPSESMDWMNGLLLRQRDYKKETSSNFTLLKDQTNYYSIREDSEYWNYLFTPTSYQSNEYVRGLGMRIIYKHPAFIFGLQFTPAEFYLNDFHHRSKWQRLDSTVATVYGNNGVPLTTRQIYYYDNPAHLLPSRMLSNNSKGQSILVQERRSQDEISGLAASAAQGKDTLEARHIIAPVLEHSVTTNGVHSRSIRTDYKYWPNGLSLPEYLLERSYGDVYEKRVQFANYDNTANLLQQSKTNDIPETYIWGYGNTVPVVKIAGSVDYNTVYGLVTQAVIQNTATTDQAMRTELNKIRVSAATAGALVTTYTYLPGVGISSETGPKGYTTYYEYDTAGRLKLIKDKNGNILKQYDYQYQQPITQ